jgi:hypothetical protein
MSKKCLNKRQIIQKHINEPTTAKRPFWKKEMTLLNRFLEEFPDQCFWSDVNFGQKFDSLAILASPNWKKLVKRKFLDYNYKIPKPTQHELSPTKIGKDANIGRRKRTIKDFLSERYE